MLCIVAFITPKEDCYDLAKQALLNILEDTRSELGCITFLLHENEEENQLCLYEQFTSQEALDEHYSKPYIVPVFEAYQEWLAKPVEVKKLKFLG